VLCTESGKVTNVPFPLQFVTGPMHVHTGMFFEETVMSTSVATPFIDFASIKKQVTFRQALALLDLASSSFNEDKQEHRLPCPRCNAGGDRAIVISEEKQSFACYAEDVQPRPSGDVIAFVAHIKNISMYQAAKLLNEAFSDGGSTEPKAKANKGFDAEKFASELDTSDEALAKFGLAPSVQDEVPWIGVIQKGHHKGKLAIPLRGGFGEFQFFAFSAEALYVPKQWRV